MAALPSFLARFPVEQFGVGLAVLVSGSLVWWLGHSRNEWRKALRGRFVMGVPWGTLLAAMVVLAVYLFVQGGLEHWYRPTVIPFRAWSYFYPLGILVSGFAHTSPGHLIGNLTGALVLGTVAEYAWGHFPTERGTVTFSSLGTNPLARAFAFAGGTLALGVVTGVFSLGPVVGFSGVVFALAGFALVRYPLATVVALVGADALEVMYRALVSPTVVQEARPQFITPWWAEISIHGHALGLLIGVLAGAGLLWYRGVRPSPLRLWVGGLLVAVEQSLWAVYWFRGHSTFVLFRGLGTGLVFVLAALITVGITASDRSLIPHGWALGRFPVSRLDVSRRIAAVAVVLIVTVGLAGVAIPTNLTTVDDTPPGEASITVRDYTVTYAEGVTNQQVFVVNVSAFGETTKVPTSGVIVTSPTREVWTTAVTKARLAFAGRTTVRLGGLGWRNTVRVRRTEWTVTGGPAVYKVHLRRAGQRPGVTFTSDPADVGPVIAGRNISIEAAERGFSIVVSRNNTTLARAPIPAANETVTLGGITFRRHDDRLVAIHDGTRVEIASKEMYPGKGADPRQLTRRGSTFSVSFWHAQSRDGRRSTGTDTMGGESVLQLV